MKTILTVIAVLIAIQSACHAFDVRKGLDFAHGIKQMIAAGERSDPNSNFYEADTTLVYLEGFFDMILINQKVNVQQPFALPERFEYRQIALVLDKYLSEHPERLNFPSSQLIIECLILNFPKKASTP